VATFEVEIKLPLGTGEDFMRINEFQIENEGLIWTLRCPDVDDSTALADLRIKIDSQTEFMDRENGEGILSSEDFKNIIAEDNKDDRSLFLVAEVEGRIVGFARCIGKKLRRFRHQADFGICVERDYWGYGIGSELLNAIVIWSEQVGLKKITLSVVEDNVKAISLYKKYGFIVEGRLIDDRYHSDGKFYNTIIMGRISGNN